MSLLIEMFQYPFMVRAFVVGTFVALCASLLGVSLVLKRYAMIGDGLSHVGFGALALATAVHVPPLAVCLPAVSIASVCLLQMKNSTTIKGDAAIALVSSSALAIGVFVISRTTGMNTDVCNYLFGSILSMTQMDAYVSIFLCTLIFILFILFYNRIFAVTFDESFAKATGVKVQRYNFLIALLTSIVIVLGLRMMGALLISSFIVFPALTGMKLCKTYRMVSFTSAIVSIACLWTGLTLSYVYATPTGASIVLCDLTVFILSCLYVKGRNAYAKKS